MSESEKMAPKKVCYFICDGCPSLSTEYWKDYLDNDETDSGTSALCLAAKKSISSYWCKGDRVPAWCPATKSKTNI